jgi:hypothetical protein
MDVNTFNRWLRNNLSSIGLFYTSICMQILYENFKHDKAYNLTTRYLDQC